MNSKDYFHNFAKRLYLSDEKYNMSTEAYVRSTRESGIRNIEFFHPAHNSLPSDILAQLAQSIADAGNDPETKVIILRSGGDRTFCAGASFNELISIEDFDTGKEFFMGFARVINACRTCPKLILGRVQGKAVGGGVGLASAVDYCIATKYASVKLSELHIGIGPFVVGPAVERKIGTSAMSELAINASEWRTAEWAKQKGLFTDVFGDAEQMDAYLKEFSERLAGYNPEAMLELKHIFWSGTGHWDELLEVRAEKSGKLVLSKFTKKALERFNQV
jgi:methylglutaconyl-CoA hydratase